MTASRIVAAAVAITFDDRSTRRRLVLEDPAAVERARRALALLDRRALKGSQPPQ